MSDENESKTYERKVYVRQGVVHVVHKSAIYAPSRDGKGSFATDFAPGQSVTFEPAGEGASVSADGKTEVWVRTEIATKRQNRKPRAKKGETDATAEAAE